MKKQIILIKTLQKRLKQDSTPQIEQTSTKKKEKESYRSSMTWYANMYVSKFWYERKKRLNVTIK